MEVLGQTQVQIEIDPVRGKRARRQSMQHFLWGSMRYLCYGPPYCPFDALHQSASKLDL